MLYVVSPTAGFVSVQPSGCVNVQPSAALELVNTVTLSRLPWSMGAFSNVPPGRGHASLASGSRRRCRSSKTMP